MALCSGQNERFVKGVPPVGRLGFDFAGNRFFAEPAAGRIFSGQPVFSYYISVILMRFNVLDMSIGKADILLFRKSVTVLITMLSICGAGR